MIKGFQFQADARSYTCTVEARAGSKNEFWWWFEVSGDPQRYAMFQAAEGDTRPSVQERVIAFYANRLWKLAQPAQQRPSQWRKREATPTDAAAPLPEKSA